MDAFNALPPVSNSFCESIHLRWADEHSDPNDNSVQIRRRAQAKQITFHNAHKVEVG